MDPQPKKVKNITFNFTGFGAFLDIKTNPTTELIESIKKWVCEEGCEFTTGDLKVLNVAADDCKTYVNDIMTELEEKEKQDPETKQVLVHLGVHGGATKIHLELHGYNKADFRGPDNNNYKPQNEKIRTTFPLDHYFKTMLPVEEICKNLKQLEHQVELSLDPGRYVCNYIYYSSLCEGYKKSIPSIFIHVPPFACVSKEKQEAFIKDFMKVAKKTLLQELN